MLERHCIESYIVEPSVVEAAFGVRGVEDKLTALAEHRFWPDVARAVLDAIGYEMRRERLSLQSEVPASEAEVVSLVEARLADFRQMLSTKPLDVATCVDAFARDMRAAPIWTRVDGKRLMRSLEKELCSSGLTASDLESKLFKWCSQNGPPEPFIAEVKRILERMLGLP